eukprot:scaffold19386_cov68-Phaeocystis_antarctica.AAC.7
MARVRVGTWNLLGARRDVEPAWRPPVEARALGARDGGARGARGDGRCAERRHGQSAPPGQRPSSAPLPLQGAPGGSGQLGAPREEAGPLGAQPCCWRSS